jgi:hypothetical protein
MAKTLKPTSDAVEVLHRRTYEGKPARMKNLEEARANEEIARRPRLLVYSAEVPLVTFVPAVLVLSEEADELLSHHRLDDPDVPVP